MLRAVSVCLLMMFMVSFIAGQNSKVDQALKEADIYINTKQYDRALQQINKALRSEPANLDALEKKINVYQSTEKLKEGYKEIDDKISARPSQGEFYYIRGVLNMYREKYAKGIKDFETALGNDFPAEELYRLYLNKGMAHLHMVEFEIALKDFEKTIELNPQFASAYHSMGMLKYETKEYEEAIENFSKAIELDESNPITYYNIAMSYFRLDQFNDACYFFNKSCTMGHRNACRLHLMECTQDVNLPQ